MSEEEERASAGPNPIGLGLLIVVGTCFALLYGRAMVLRPAEDLLVTTALGAALLSTVFYVLLKKLSVDLMRIGVVKPGGYFERVGIPGITLAVGFLKLLRMQGHISPTPTDAPLLLLAVVVLVVMADFGGLMRRAVNNSRLFNVQGGGWGHILYRQYPPERLADIAGFLAVVTLFAAYLLIY